MGRQLYETEPVFRQTITQCHDRLQQEFDLSLITVFYPQSGQVSPIHETAYTQPALFAIEYGQLEIFIRRSP